MMERLPFDPSRIAGPPEDPVPARRERARGASIAEARQLTVSELSRLIQVTLEDRLPGALRVVGEVSNFSARQHWYFSLKDAEAVIGCVIWASAAKKLTFTPADGEQVLAIGRVGHYPPQGRTQFYVEKLEPVGAGALDRRFRELCEELRRAGYFDEARKRPLPLLPRRIAVITSAGGAALQDVLATAKQRCRAVGIVVYDVKVQGEGAKDDVVRAIRRANDDRATLGIDAILVTRGGGSIEDLWTFNEREVADAVFRSRLPVVAAIGHESDTTIIELVADVRAATPTQAAMRLVPSSAELIRHVKHDADRLSRALRRELDTAGRDVESLADSHAQAMRHALARRRLNVERWSTRLESRRPTRILADRRMRVGLFDHRLRAAMERFRAFRPELDRRANELRRALLRRIDGHRHSMAAMQSRLGAVEVASVLRRGFSYTLRDDGRLVTTIRDVEVGGGLSTHVADGVIDSLVRGSRSRTSSPSGETRTAQANASGASGRMAARSGRRVSRAQHPRQLDLFASNE